LAPRSGLEAAQLAADAVLDGGIVADVEVEVAERARRPPVAAVERVALLHVERAGDHLLASTRRHQAEPVAQPLSGELEEAPLEVLLPPGEPLDGRPIEVEHPRQERSGDIGARVHGDRHAVLGRGAALTAHLVATFAAQAREVVVERREAGIRPVVLVGRALEPAALPQRRGLVGQAEVDVDRREALTPAPLLEYLGEHVDDLASPACRRQEAGPGDGREGYTDEELRVVADPRAPCGRGPALVEDELTQAVALHVERARAHQLAVLPERQVLGQPAGRGDGAPRVLEGGEPLPLEERRALLPHDRVPRDPPDVPHDAQDPERPHMIDFTQPPSTSMQAPVIQEASSEQRNTTRWPVSTGSPKRPAGSGRRAPKYSLKTMIGSSSLRPVRATAEATAAS